MSILKVLKRWQSQDESQLSHALFLIEINLYRILLEQVHTAEVTIDEGY